MVTPGRRFSLAGHGRGPPGRPGWRRRVAEAALPLWESAAERARPTCPPFVTARVSGPGSSRGGWVPPVRARSRGPGLRVQPELRDSASGKSRVRDGKTRPRGRICPSQASPRYLRVLGQASPRAPRGPRVRRRLGHPGVLGSACQANPGHRLLQDGGACGCWQPSPFGGLVQRCITRPAPLVCIFCSQKVCRSLLRELKAGAERPTSSRDLGSNQLEVLRVLSRERKGRGMGRRTKANG